MGRGAVTQQEPVREVEWTFCLRRPVHVELDRASPHAKLVEDRVNLIRVEVRRRGRVGSGIKAVVGTDDIVVGNRGVKVKQPLCDQ